MSMGRCGRELELDLIIPLLPSRYRALPGARHYLFPSRKEDCPTPSVLGAQRGEVTGLRSHRKWQSWYRAFSRGIIRSGGAEGGPGMPIEPSSSLRTQLFSLGALPTPCHSHAPFRPGAPWALFSWLPRLGPELTFRGRPFVSPTVPHTPAGIQYILCC